MEGHVGMSMEDLERKRVVKDVLSEEEEEEEEEEERVEEGSHAVDAKELERLACQVVSDLCENEAICLGQNLKQKRHTTSASAKNAKKEKEEREDDEDEDEDEEEATVLDKTYTVVKHFSKVSNENKTRIADCLGSNLSVLNATVDATCADMKASAAGAGAAANNKTSALEDDDLRILRLSLKIHVVLLHSILLEATAFGNKNAGAGGADGRKKGAKNAAASRKGNNKVWEWLFALEKILRPLSCSAGLDLLTLYSTSGCPDVRDQLLNKFSASALLVLNCNNALATGPSGSSIKESLARLIAVSSHKIMQDDCPVEGAESKLDSLLPAFVDAINKSEAASTILVDASIYASQALSNSKLGKELVNELAKVDPRDYRVQQQSDSQGVKNVASFLIDVAERLPHVMTSCLSVVVPHLGGEAYSLRSGVVTIISRILVQHSSSGSSAASHAPTGSETFLKSKQHFLKILVERIFDKSSFTRSKTLQSWAYLCQHKAIPIGYWNYIAEIAIGRLEDKTALVRKSALQLLSTMLQYNPFAPCLPVAKFELSLQEYQEKLSAAKKEKGLNDEQKSEVEGEEIAEGEGGEGAAPPAAAASGAIGDDEEEGEDGADDPELASLRALVASLDSAVKFCKNLTGSLGTVSQLLASSSITDATEAISFIVLLCQFQIQGAEEAARKILPLIFSHEQTVKDAVIDGFAQLYIRDGGHEAQLASVLSNLVVTLNVGEMASLERIFKDLWAKKILDHSLVDELLNMLPHMGSTTEGFYTLQGALHLFSLIAQADSDVVVDNLRAIIQAGFSGRAPRKNPYIYRSVCHVFTNLPRGSFVLKSESPVFGKIVQIIAGKAEHIPSVQWYSVAESCISALYALSENPETTACTILSFMANGIATAEGGLSVKKTARFLFVVGQVAIKHLVHIESLGSQVRQRKSESKIQGAEDEDDISDQIGAGAAAADAALDTLLEETEKEIMHGNNIVALCGPLLSELCSNRPLMQNHVELRVAATLALAKLMLLDSNFCKENIAVLLQDMLQDTGSDAIGTNLVIAVGDLVKQFPNQLEPYTKALYGCLSSKKSKVRMTGLHVLMHLILSSHVKTSGNISSLARLLLDPDKRIASFAELFFHQLSRKTATSVYNLIPDILSNLTNDENLEEDGFKYIMQHILAFIQRDKQKEGLTQKLRHRLKTACGDEERKNLDFCISQLNVSSKPVTTA